MFQHIFLFELRYRFRRTATYVYFVLLFLIGWFYGSMLGGGFGPEAAGMLTQGGQNLANSPYNLHLILMAIGQIGIFIVAAFMGVPIIRDYQREAHHFFFTKPISKWSYLGGRFAGSFLIALLVLLSAALGMIFTELMPYVNPEKYGPFNLYAYLHPYLINIIPFSFFTSAIFFSTVALSRNQLFIYLNAILVLVLLNIASGISSVIDNKTLASLLDPTGGMAFMNETEYWTVEQRNTQVVPFSKVILGNQAIWTGVALLILGLTYLRFQFSYLSTEAQVFVSRKGSTIKRIADTVVLKRLELPRVRKRFGLGEHLRQLAILTRRELQRVLASPIFWVLVAVAILMFGILVAFEGLMFGTPTLPLTYRMIDAAVGSFILFNLAIIVFYSGEMVWRERSLNISPLFDALPVPNWLALSSKLLAMLGVIITLQLVIMLCAIFAQLVQGFLRVELGLYLQTLLGYRMIDYVLFACLAFFVHVLSPNKYLGFFLSAGIYLFIEFFFQPLGLEHRLWSYMSSTPLPYSDMNGYGHFVWPFLAFKLYWAGLAAIFVILSFAFWQRGPETHWRARLQHGLANLKTPEWVGLAAATLLFVGMGSYIYYNTNVLNTYLTSKDRQRIRADYEKEYKQYQGIAQPKITDISLEIDIFPEARSWKTKGRYVLKNKSQQYIDSIHVMLSDDMDYGELVFSKPFNAVSEDSTMGYFIYQLETSLEPGDTLSFRFEQSYEDVGFPNSGFNTSVIENGTFFNHYIYPSFGYEPQYELQDRDLREKYELPPDRDRFPSIDDTVAVYGNLIARDADWIDFEAVVSTSPDQIAMVPGYLQREWEEGDRRYFHYKMDSKMLKFFSIVSARYAVKEDVWQAPDGRDIQLEIYHHPDHTYNLDRMMEAMKQTLAYCTEHFGPYQHRQLRVLEFPRYRSFAQSFANTVPFSEAAGFIADVDEDDVDYPFYVTSHEVAHQWWAHQVVGGYVQGFQFLSETMAQYTALMVMKQAKGEDNIKKYLKHEMDTYLTNRTAERQREMPALLSENQMYIHYNKGSVIMYALMDYLGEDSLNAAMRRYVEAVKFQEPPFTTTQEWLKYVEEVTPDSLRYAITDMFETITLFENRAKEATYEQVDDRYKVSLEVSSKKLRDDGEGVESEVPVDDYIDIGVFGREKINGKWQDVPLYFEKHHITQNEQTITVWVDSEPREAGIDPYYKLIDRNTSDNTTRVTKQSE